MQIRWGILGTGNIASTFASGLTESAHGRLAAIASRSAQGAEAFPTGEADVVRYASYDEVLQAADIDAIYIATPHSSHAEWAIRAMQAGKAVLCEKPLGINHAEAMAMVQAAEDSGALLMEGLMYRLHPQTQALLDAVATGRIGELRHIEASFGFAVPFDAASRLFRADLAGGAILDVGCYPLSLAIALAGAPVTLTANARLAPTGVDALSTACATFAGGVTATLTTAIDVALSNRVVLHGTTGRLELENPWVPDTQWQLTVIEHAGSSERVDGGARPLYTLEADHFAETLAAGAGESAVLTHKSTLTLAGALDQWRAAVDVSYPVERIATDAPLRRLPAIAATGTDIPSTTVPGLAKPVSRLVMGCDNQPSIAHAAVMWDDFLHLGGNCFDTAWLYGNGEMEALLGHWQHQRGVRDEIVIVGKGAHTPLCEPATVRAQLDESLARLQTGYVDIYMLHRDNLEVPVGEFMDALQTEVADGRVRALGVSNWSLERVQAANDYAARHALTPLTCISNNFSLARMVAPVWPGVAAATTQAWRDYLTREQLALLPWSSQARGFFTAWAEGIIRESGADGAKLALTAGEPTAAELARVWFAPDNFERRAWAEQVAAKHGVPLINVALAYVLQQPFTTLPLIGPRSLSELRSCCRALAVTFDDEDWGSLPPLAGR